MIADATLPSAPAQRIDVHAHHLPARYMEMLRAADGPAFGAAHDASTLQGMIEGQDRVGLDVQILSTGPSSPYLADEAAAVAAAREVNDKFHDVVARHGGRFAAFGSAPLPHGQAAAAEAVRCLDELHFAGMHFGCSARGRALNDGAFAEMWMELDRRAAIIYIHPGGIVCGSEPGLAGMGDPAIAVTIGSAAELATAALCMAGLCRTHRRLRVIIGLLGGSLPFLLRRVIMLGERFKGRSVAAEPSLHDELRQFHYDTNLLPDPAVLATAHAAYGLDRLLFGSDAPGFDPQVTERFMRAGGMTEREFTQVLQHNPSRLFGTPLARTRTETVSQEIIG